MTKIFGIDISHYQQYMNLSAAKGEGVNFAIIRGMYGNAKDVAFENNYSKAKSEKLGVGVYQWGRARNEAQAREEAQLLVDHCLKGKQFEYPIYYDVEDSILISLSVEELTRVITAWCETIENCGYFAGVYMNQSCFNNEVKGAELAKKYSQWRAYWTTKQPDCQMWQFGGETNLIRSNKIAGQVCDQDYALQDFPAIIKTAGLNGFSKSGSNPVATKSVDELAQEVINGKWGNDEARRIALNNAGYDYQTVQNKVNEILKKSTSTVQYYTVKKGDYLTKIAKEFGSSVHDIIGWNNIKNANIIYIGQKIRVK